MAANDHSTDKNAEYQNTPLSGATVTCNLISILLLGYSLLRLFILKMISITFYLND